MYYCKWRIHPDGDYVDANGNRWQVRYRSINGPDVDSDKFKWYDTEEEFLEAEGLVYDEAPPNVSP